MTLKELQHIISLNESETLDFKRLWKDDFFKTIDCKALNIPEPQYNYQASFFSITFLKSVNEPVNERQKNLLN